jgi:hypothetical protein
MTPTNFPQANATAGAPPDMDKNQVMAIRAYYGPVVGGSCDGAPLVVTAWKPSKEEIDLIQQGKPIFISHLGGLPPHFLSMSFEQATHPA